MALAVSLCCREKRQDRASVSAGPPWMNGSAARCGTCIEGADSGVGVLLGIADDCSVDAPGRRSPPHTGRTDGRRLPDTPHTKGESLDVRRQGLFLCGTPAGTYRGRGLGCWCRGPDGRGDGGGRLRSQGGAAHGRVGEAAGAGEAAVGRGLEGGTHDRGIGMGKGCQEGAWRPYEVE